MEELTEQQAIALSETRFWENATPDEIFRFQLFTRRLCMPFGVFHEAAEKVLGRSVWTHEFAFLDELKREYLGEKPAPTFNEILALIPANKTVIVGVE